MALETEPRQRVRARQGRFARLREGIRSDDMLSAEGKDVAVAAAWHHERAARNALLQEHRAIEAAERLRLQRRVFGPEDGDHADLRSALQSVQGVDGDTLVATLEFAHRRGDATLARACLSRGLDRMHERTVERWCELYPDGAEAVRELAHLEHEISDVGDRIVMGWEFGVPKPPELARMTDSQIEAIGRQHEGEPPQLREPGSPPPPRVGVPT